MRNARFLSLNFTPYITRLTLAPILPPHRERHGRNVQGKGNAERLYSAYNQTDNPCAKNGAQLQCKQALLGTLSGVCWNAVSGQSEDGQPSFTLPEEKITEKGGVVHALNVKVIHNISSSHTGNTIVPGKLQNAIKYQTSIQKKCNFSLYL